MGNSEKGGHDDDVDLEKPAPRKFPLWANVRRPGRNSDELLCFALHGSNVDANVTSAEKDDFQPGITAFYNSDRDFL